jgi:hypothetical protein
MRGTLGPAVPAWGKPKSRRIRRNNTYDSHNRIDHRDYL